MEGYGMSAAAFGGVALDLDGHGRVAGQVLAVLLDERGELALDAEVVVVEVDAAAAVEIGRAHV